MIVDHTDRDQEERNLQLDDLEEHLDAIASIFRWLWTTNFLAAVTGIGTRLYWLAAVAGISSVVSLVGAGVVRRAMRWLTTRKS